MPEIIEIKGELKTVNVRIDGLNTRIDDMDKRLTTKIDALDNRLTGEIQGLKESLNVVQRRSP
ncbi:MAG: hypothetical protein ACREBQ_08870 [Nitrososphaerales archaeon]